MKQATSKVSEDLPLFMWWIGLFIIGILNYLKINTIKKLFRASRNPIGLLDSLAKILSFSSYKTRREITNKKKEKLGEGSGTIKCGI